MLCLRARVHLFQGDFLLSFRYRSHISLLSHRNRSILPFWFEICEPLSLRLFDSRAFCNDIVEFIIRTNNYVYFVQYNFVCYTKEYGRRAIVIVRFVFCLVAIRFLSCLYFMLQYLHWWCSFSQHIDIHNTTLSRSSTVNRRSAKKKK